jgi:DNA-binding response OmpR family regulator
VVTTVLVVDDDATVREVVATYLRRDGLEVIEADDGSAALSVDSEHDPDLVVLDLMLPGLDGLEVFRRLRARRGGIPVVMLTARGDEDDRVLGLEIGADDYVAKPFSPRELVLRVQALLRRTSQASEATPARVVDGDLVIEPRSRTVTRGGEPLMLTAREFDLLRHLVASAGTAWSRTELMNDVWGWEYGDESTVTVHVRRLREKVEDDPSNPIRLMTVWGVGYRWDRHEP